LQKQFENLAQDVQDSDKSTSKTDNKPSPIFVARVANVILLMILLDRIAKNKYDIKVLSNIQIKIQPITSIKYILIIKKLKNYKHRFSYLQNERRKKL